MSDPINVRALPPGTVPDSKTVTCAPRSTSVTAAAMPA